MSHGPDDALIDYVARAARLTEMPLSVQRIADVAGVMLRIAEFAADLRALPLDDEVEIAGIFKP